MSAWSKVQPGPNKFMSVVIASASVVIGQGSFFVVSLHIGVDLRIYASSRCRYTRLEDGFASSPGYVVFMIGLAQYSRDWCGGW